MVWKEYLKENWDYINFQSKLDDCIKDTNTIREKIVAYALFFATQMPKLPYFWGGGHECSIEQMQGLNKDWGKLKPILFAGSNNYQVGCYYPYSLDCSSFISWCLINSSVNLNKVLSSPDLYKLGSALSITDPKILNYVQIGDFAFMLGHIGIIVDIDKDNKILSVVHISFSGQGINITKVSTISGLIVEDDVGIVDNNFEIRVGKEYFREVILVNKY